MSVVANFNIAVAYDRLLMQTTKLLGLTGCFHDWFRSYYFRLSSYVALGDCRLSFIDCTIPVPLRSVPRLHHLHCTSRLSNRRVASPTCWRNSALHVDRFLSEWRPCITVWLSKWTCQVALWKWSAAKSGKIKEALVTGLRQQVNKFKCTSGLHLPWLNTPTESESWASPSTATWHLITMWRVVCSAVMQLSYLQPAPTSAISSTSTMHTLLIAPM